MISREKFEELIQEYYEQEARIDKICEIFPGIYGEPIFDYGFRMFDGLIDSYFDEIGSDWITYYLYENPEKCYYEDNKRIPLESIDDLWMLIEKHRK